MCPNFYINIPMLQKHPLSIRCCSILSFHFFVENDIIIPVSRILKKPLTVREFTYIRKELVKMSVESVRKFFAEGGYTDLKIIETNLSTATVELAAKAHGVAPALIAKTMSFGLKDREILIVTKGDARIDNRKFKDCFHEKASMLDYDRVLEVTGHPVGGVCPFGLKNPLDIYLDISMKEFEYVYPAAGSANSAVKIAPDRLQEVTGGIWIDVCK